MKVADPVELSAPENRPATGTESERHGGNLGWPRL
jgi:hypothetical protein